MKANVIYMHGQGGNPAEAAHYQPLFPKCRVVGLDYHAETPWEAREELPRLFDEACGEGGPVTLIANSIGAYFAMCALADRSIEQAWFISPVVDMERLIRDMMTWAGISEDELRARGEIATAFGQTLSWQYLSWVRENPVRWQVPTHILYAGKDHLTSRETITAFARQNGATLTVMEEGEHWFHTEEQMRFLDRWIAGTGKIRS